MHEAELRSHEPLEMAIVAPQTVQPLPERRILREQARDAVLDLSLRVLDPAQMDETPAPEDQCTDERPNDQHRSEPWQLSRYPGRRRAT